MIESNADRAEPNQTRPSVGSLGVILAQFSIRVDFLFDLVNFTVTYQVFNIILHLLGRFVLIFTGALLQGLNQSLIDLVLLIKR